MVSKSLAGNIEIAIIFSFLFIHIRKRTIKTLTNHDVVWYNCYDRKIP